MPTRRRFLERIAATGGAALAYETMTGPGLMAAQPAAPFGLRGDGKGMRVVVIGAGLTGLTVAHELGKLGYHCQVLEARERPGGRAHTVRHGTVSEEDGPGQTCAFDEGQYLNCGAMRIAYHHTTILAYCRELAVPVETFALLSEAAYVYQSRTPSLAGRRLNAAMIHSGMEPVSPLTNPAAKVFAIASALASGVFFQSMVAVLLAPGLQHLLHRFHLELDQDRRRPDANDDQSVDS